MPTSEWVTLSAALLSAILAILARVDPDGVLANGGMQNDVMTAFVAACALFVAMFSTFKNKNQSKDQE